MREIFIALAIVAIDVFTFANRFHTCLKEKKPLDQASMWILYILPLVLHSIIGRMLPDMTKVVSIVLLLVLFVPTYFTVRAVKKYHDRKLAELDQNR